MSKIAEQKALEIQHNDPCCIWNNGCPNVRNGAMKMAQWKDEQYKTAYVVTRSEEHCDYVEKVFFDKEKAEEYCKPFNEDENSYHRDITKIEVTL
jgi:hypothetical protein